MPGFLPCLEIIVVSLFNFFCLYFFYYMNMHLLIFCSFFAYTPYFGCQYIRSVSQLTRFQCELNFSFRIDFYTIQVLLCSNRSRLFLLEFHYRRVIIFFFDLTVVRFVFDRFHSVCVSFSMLNSRSVFICTIFLSTFYVAFTAT